MLELDFAPFSLGYTCWSKMEGAAPEVGFCAMPAGMHVLEKKEPAAPKLYSMPCSLGCTCWSWILRHAKKSVKKGHTQDLNSQPKALKICCPPLRYTNIGGRDGNITVFEPMFWFLVGPSPC